MDTGDPLGVRITGREIYDAVLTLTGRVDTVIGQHQTTQQVAADHETRLRSLERSRWPLPSLAALVSLASLVLALIAYATRH